MTIIRNEEIRSGKPTIRGTRVTVGDIVDRFYRLGRSGKEIAEDLNVEESDVEDALRYYHNEVLDQTPSGIEA
jgi:uncharacterized protein (DUF433 family)